jgi:hypothetical protein
MTHMYIHSFAEVGRFCSRHYCHYSICNQSYYIYYILSNYAKEEVARLGLNFLFVEVNEVMVMNSDHFSRRFVFLYKELRGLLSGRVFVTNVYLEI